MQRKKRKCSAFKSKVKKKRTPQQSLSGHDYELCLKVMDSLLKLPCIVIIFDVPVISYNSKRVGAQCFIMEYIPDESDGFASHQSMLIRARVFGFFRCYYFCFCLFLIFSLAIVVVVFFVLLILFLLLFLFVSFVCFICSCCCCGFCCC